MTPRRRWQSRLACQWSALKLFPDMEEAQLFPTGDNLPVEFQKTAFLWTWTFADDLPRTNATEAMRRWYHHAKWLKRTGKQCLRALERGGKNGSYHIHAITHQRWDINEIREHATKSGFGRINVTVIPRERVGYIAKYLGKPGRFPIPKGVRLWATIGYQGTRKNDVKCHITELTVNVPDKYPRLISVKRWTLDGVILHERLVRNDWNGDKTEIQTMNITKENLAHIAQCIASGAILAVAEYRTCSVRKLEFAEEDKKGNLTGKKVTRKIVEHGVELGSEQITVSEWLPDDADITQVKGPAQKGEAVLVEVAGFSKRYGITAKSIRSLANFNGKLS